MNLGSSLNVPINMALERIDKTAASLGMGDFWFYGILVTRAARLGWDVSIPCIHAIVLWLAIMLATLDWAERPLPALPFSLALGMCALATAVWSFQPFLECVRAAGIAF
jgi:presenilin 1